MSIEDLAIQRQIEDAEDDMERLLEYAETADIAHDPLVIDLAAALRTTRAKLRAERSRSDTRMNAYLTATGIPSAEAADEVHRLRSAIDAQAAAVGSQTEEP